MTTKSLAYDNPAYIAPVIYSSGTPAGANGVSEKFAAFTAQKIKSVTVGVNTAGTSATQPLLYTKSGTATATATLTAIASAAITPQNYPVTVALAQGDQFWVTHGTDATIATSVAIETYVDAGAALTA